MRWTGNEHHELRAFTLSLSTNAATARGQGHGSFVNSVLAAVDKFYTSVVQRIKPWAPAPPKVKESEPPASDTPVPDKTPAEVKADRLGVSWAVPQPAREAIQLAEAVSQARSAL